MSKTLIIQGETLGRGDDRLGAGLMANFLRLLGENKEKPAYIILWNSGVRLACQGSPVIDHLSRLEKQGVEVRSCTTCLEYFSLTDKLVVGKPTTMPVSIEALMSEGAVCL